MIAVKVLNQTVDLSWDTNLKELFDKGYFFEDDFIELLDTQSFDVFQRDLNSLLPDTILDILDSEMRLDNRSPLQTWLISHGTDKGRFGVYVMPDDMKSLSDLWNFGQIENIEFHFFGNDVVVEPI